VAEPSKACVCGRWLAGIAGSNPAGGMDVLSLVSVVCCQVEVFTAGRSLARRSLNDCGVSEYDLGTSTMRSLRPTGGGGQSSHIQWC
jgi:hypothetical protein